MTQVQEKRIKELEAEVLRLQNLVDKDELTKVFNRRGFCENLEFIFKEAIYSKEHADSQRKFRITDLSVIFIDIDNFKQVNDTFGHSIGDVVLKSVAKILKESVRDIDLVGRFGGEELVIALLGATESDAYRKAEEVRKKIENYKPIFDEDGLGVTVSVGVASVDNSNADTFEDLISFADKAMYEAKTNRGKNNTVKYSEIS